MADGLVASGEDVPRLSAVIERQRREIARGRADREADRGRRDGQGRAHGAARLVNGRGRPPARGHGRRGGAHGTRDGRRRPRPGAAVAAGPASRLGPGSPGPDSGLDPHAGARAWLPRPRPEAAPGEWLEAGTALGPADDPVAIAAAERAKDGAELVGVLAEQLRSRFGATAVAVWLLDADGALDLFGQDGLGGTESSRWRRLPPQFDCVEQRVIADGGSCGGRTGSPRRTRCPPPRRGGAARPAWCSGCGTGPGCCSAWPKPGGRPRGACSTSRPGSGCQPRSTGSPTSSACAWPTAPWDRPRRPCRSSPAIDQFTESALVVRPLRDADGAVTDFGVVHMSHGYVDPAGPGRRARRADAA